MRLEGLSMRGIWSGAMKTMSLLLLSLVTVIVNPAFAGRGTAGSNGGGAMSQDDVTAVKQEMTNHSDQATDPNAQPKTDAAQDQTKSDNSTK